MSKNRYQKPRGMQDILPQDQMLWGEILDIFDIPEILGLNGGFPFKGSLVGD